MNQASKYDFGFSGGPLNTKEFVLFVQEELGLISPSESEKRNYKKRKASEFKKRLNQLTSKQVDALLEGDSILQRQLAYLSVCKVYGFIRDFVLEVLREKLQLMDYQLTDGEYLSFVRRKMIDHPELEQLSETTAKKVRQVLFRMLAEVGIIDSVKGKVLQYQILDPQLTRLIQNDDPIWFEVFLLSESEIASYSM